MPFYENPNHYRWLSEVEFMLSIVEVAKTPPQIFDQLSSFIAEMFPSTSLRERL